MAPEVCPAYDNPIKIAGINNVITPKAYRGEGFASKMLSETLDFILGDLKSELGVLLCADNLIPFHQRLHRYKGNCPVIVKKEYGQ